MVISTTIYGNLSLNLYSSTLKHTDGCQHHHSTVLTTYHMHVYHCLYGHFSGPL